ncbi:hypothetical protein AB1N83_004465 [Pleurotus pulmonarius]
MQRCIYSKPRPNPLRMSIIKKPQVFSSQARFPSAPDYWQCIFSADVPIRRIYPAFVPISTNLDDRDGLVMSLLTIIITSETCSYPNDILAKLLTDSLWQTYVLRLIIDNRNHRDYYFRRQRTPTEYSCYRSHAHSFGRSRLHIKPSLGTNAIVSIASS